MKLVLDENVDNRIHGVLEDMGFRVETTYDLGLTGTPDEEILEELDDGDVVLSHDDDFLAIVEEKDSHPVIAFLPQRIRFREMKKRVKELDADTENRGEVIYL